MGWPSYEKQACYSILCTGCANKNNPLEKLLYINNNSTSLSQTFAVYVRVCTQHILQISLKQLIWFKRYNSLNFKVHFFKWTCSRALNIHEQTLHNFSSTVQTFQWWMSASHSVFKRVFKMSTSCSNTWSKSLAKW